jgi:tetratricopeptide (TPR) repeat protein
MNQSETDIELIEKYFDAELNKNEQNAFIERINVDAGFQRLVQQERALINAIRYEGISKDLRYLKKVESSLQSPNQQTAHRKWYYLAAAAIIGIVALAIFILPTFRPSSDQLFQAYFVPYPNMFEPTLRDNRQPTNDPRTAAFKAYEEQDYQRAAMLFSELLIKEQEPGILLLLGNANLILGNTDDAMKNFGILSKEFDELDMQAKWYLSLCYLKRGDIDQAKKMLKELGETEISYAERARELLKKVE